MLVYDTALEELTGDDALVAIGATDEENVGEEGTEESEETVNPVLPTGGDIIYAVIFFFALWAAMKYVLLPPIQKVRAERAQKISAARDAADNASADMGSAQADYDAAIAGSRTEAASILEQARAEAEAHRAEVIGAAEAEVSVLREASAGEVSTARGQAMGTLTNDIAEVAASAASTVLGKQIDPASARSIVESLGGPS